MTLHNQLSCLSYHPVTHLSVKHYHEMDGHWQGVHSTHESTELLATSIRISVRQCLRQCRHCRRLFTAPGVQRMADLHSERVAVDEPPFTNVGVDCFGPFLAEDGRKETKHYGCIFTCVTSRAVHIESFDSMGTSSFLNAMQRFICRRGNM